MDVFHSTPTEVVKTNWCVCSPAMNAIISRWRWQSAFRARLHDESVQQYVDHIMVASLYFGPLRVNDNEAKLITDHPHVALLLRDHRIIDPFATRDRDLTHRAIDLTQAFVGTKAQSVFCWCVERRQCKTGVVGKPGSPGMAML